MKIYLLRIAMLSFLMSCIIILSCAKDGHLDTSQGTEQKLESRNAASLEVSYDMINVSVIEPEIGKFEDMCIGDIRMLNQLTRLFNVSSTITEQGETCMEVIRHQEVLSGIDGGNSRAGVPPGYEYISTTKYCNQILTFTTRDTVTTKTMTINQEYWKKIIQGYLYTETEIINHFVTMVDSLEAEGATIIEDDTTISITETTATGEQIISVYNKHNHLILFTKEIDAAGTTKNSFIYDYTCSPEGVLVPKTIFIKSKEISSICRTPFTKMEWMMFDNYSVSIN